jgi:hypothetical protein
MVWDVEGHERGRGTDLLDGAATESAVGVAFDLLETRFDELKLDARRAAVEDEDSHWGILFPSES